MLDQSNSTVSDIARAALGYQKRGWHVIAIHSVRPDGSCLCMLGKKCKSQGKHPVNKGWQSADKPDAQAVEKMWTNRPVDNVGIATGDTSGFFVIDIDPQAGGMESMRELIAAHGRLPETFATQTGSLGWHYYFQMPDFPVNNSARGFPAGIDIRGTGGQVVAAPSVSAKGPYLLRFDKPIAPAPDWVLNMLRRPEPEPVRPLVNPQASGVVLNQSVREAAIEKSAVAGELKRVADLAGAEWGQPWDSTTFEVACNLIELANSDRAKLSTAEARGQFLQSCPAPEDGYDPEAKWDSAIRRVGDKARVLVPAETKDFMDDTTGMRIDPLIGTSAPVPTAGGGGPPDPGRFFGDGGLLAATLATEVMAVGPIRHGQDGRWWTYDTGRGVWHEDKDAVVNRTVALLGDRFRGGHAANVETVVGAYAPALVMDEPSTQWMNFANGMLDWRTGEMKSHGQEFESIIGFPMRYDPQATCPRFDAFLAQTLTPDYVRLTWEMIGYLLYSGNPLQKAFMLHGTGANGKGTLVRVIQDMLGKGNTSTQSLDALATNRFAASSLFGKIANLAGDIDGTFQESTAMFKMLTGEDRVSGEHKFGQSFTFNCWAVPVFSANKVPGSADVSVGYLRRWVSIEFGQSFGGDPILGLSDQLICERDGIAAKALTFLGPLLDRRKFDVQGDARAGAEKFAMDLDQVRQWVDECCMPAPGHRSNTAAMYQRYRSWASSNGGKGLKSTTFAERLHAIGYEQKKVHGARLTDGVMMIEQKVESNLEGFLT